MAFDPSFTVKTTDTLVNDVLRRLLVAFNETATPSGRDTLTDINPGSILRTLTEAICAEMGYDSTDSTTVSVYNQLINVYNSGFIDYATGSALDLVVAILDVERKEAAKSTGTITFRRTTVPSSDFTIPAATVVTTEPNANADAVEFDTASATNWYITIADEAVVYDEDETEFDCAQKFIYEISSITGTKFNDLNYVGADEATPTVDHKAYYLTSLDLVDDGAATPAPTSPDDIILLPATAEFATADYTKIKSNNDIRVEKTGSTTLNFHEYMLFEYDLTDFISVVGNVAKLIPRFEGYGNSDTSGGMKCFLWNKTDLVYDSFGDSTGAIDGATEDSIVNLSIANTQTECAKYIDGNNKVWILVESYGTASGATPTAPMLGCDYTSLCVSEEDYTFTQDTDYELMNYVDSDSGYDVVNWLTGGEKPEDGTSFYVSYTPLSLDITINAVVGGDDGNVGLNKITIIKSALPQIDSCNNYEGTVGGGDIESDAELRYRARNALQTLGKATAIALKFAILDVDEVRDVSIDDTPSVTVNNEEHTFVTGALEQSLNEDGISEMVEVTGTVSGGAYTFVLDTDYKLEGDLKTLEWLAAGQLPDDATVYYCDYIYDQKGVANALVLGTTIPLPDSVITEIETVIEETKAAGIIVNIQETSTVEINVTASVTIADGVNWQDVKSDMTAEITAYLQGLDIGEDVIHSELVYECQGVTGVYDVQITTPSANVAVPASDIVSVGIITLTNVT